MDERLFFPAVQRNKQYIGDVLDRFLNRGGSVLEIGSGSGEHGVIFQKRFNKIFWQTSDPNISYRKSISAWISYSNLTTKMGQPLDLDVVKRPWPLTSKFIASLQGIISINMIHIAPWSCALALFEEAGQLLNKNKFLILYGPFMNRGVHISESNSLFDQSLRLQNQSWGVRDLEEVRQLAFESGFKDDEVIPMPANNFMIIFRTL